MSDLFAEPALAADSPAGLGRALAGGVGKAARQRLDFYPTPPAVTRAFLRVEGEALRDAAPGPVWECCGRGGAMLAELRGAGFDVVGSDLVPDPVHGVEGLDVLRAEVALGRKVVTNPPFAIAAEIIAHLLGKLDLPYVAMLLKAQYWHADERAALFRAFRPARIWALQWRPDFLGGGNPTMDCQWTVWHRPWGGQHGDGGTQFNLLTRDGDRRMGKLL